jgi:hypothetical protein
MTSRPAIASATPPGTAAASHPQAGKPAGQPAPLSADQMAHPAPISAKQNRHEPATTSAIANTRNTAIATPFVY